MKTSQLVALVIQIGKPAHLIGEPGIGKTAFSQDLTSKLNYNLETMIASNHEPADINGFPAAIGEYAKFLPMPMIQRILELDAKDQISTLIFLDEISTAPPAMQAACLRLLHERYAGEKKLPNSTQFLLASNPVGTSSGVFNLSGAMANRMFHFIWKADPTAYGIGLIQGFDKFEPIKLPKDWRKYIPESKTLVSSFIGVNNNLLLKQPKEANLQAGPWPSPRTWEMFAEAQAAAMSLDLTTEELQNALIQLASAVVGEGAALEYITFFDNRDLKRPEEYLEDPEKIKLPERSDQTFATLNSIVSYIINQEKPTKKNWEAAWTIMGRVAKKGQADFAAVPARILIKNRPEGWQIPTMVEEFLPALDAAGLIKHKE